MEQAGFTHLVNEQINGETGPAREFDPNYITEASAGRRSKSSLLSLVSGTGFDIYQRSIIPAIKQARQEVILVTCFWAKSETRNQINAALRELSDKAIASSSRISIRICFSSSSLARNLLLPTPKSGQAYPPSKRVKLGLPPPQELQGLDIRITRKFFWPFGIIHSKYIIIDREVAIFPSCNVSWERWFEVALSTRGPVVDYLLSFHRDFWETGGSLAELDQFHGSHSTALTARQDSIANETTSSSAVSASSPGVSLLPSPHTPAFLPNHLQPNALLGQLPCFPGDSLSFPPTPLLKATVHILATAKDSIVILTPNLTEPVVLEALERALERGVNVNIWTNRTLMTLEQLVTAGTTTPRCLRALKKKSRREKGSLKISLFDDGPGAQEVPAQRQESTPIKLHAKVTITDGKRILLGSGNMDAASWSTSQELGVLVESEQLVAEFKRLWSYDSLE